MNQSGQRPLARTAMTVLATVAGMVSTFAGARRGFTDASAARDHIDWGNSRSMVLSLIVTPTTGYYIARLFE
jgi:hypothetical protein